MPSLNSLMSGGFEPDITNDLVTDFELWLGEMRDKASKMSLQELHSERLDALLDKDETLAEIYEIEIAKREPVINISGYSTLADEPTWIDNPEHEDRRKDYLENYAADQLEQDELPF